MGWEGFEVYLTSSQWLVSSILSDSSSDILHKSKIIEGKCDVESTDGI